MMDSWVGWLEHALSRQDYGEAIQFVTELKGLVDRCTPRREVMVSMNRECACASSSSCCSKLLPGRRYLVRIGRRGNLQEVHVLEVSPQGHVRLRYVDPFPRTGWLTRDQLDEVELVEELPPHRDSSGTLHDRVVTE